MRHALDTQVCKTDLDRLYFDLETLTFTSHCVPAGQDDAIVTDQKILVKYPFNIAKANPDFHKFADDCETELPVTLAGDVRYRLFFYSEKVNCLLVLLPPGTFLLESSLFFTA